MPITPDDDSLPGHDTGKGPATNGAGTGAGPNAAASPDRNLDMAPEADNDDAFDEVDLDEEPGTGQGLSDLVRDNPISALIGAFVAGFLVARLL